MESRTGDGHPQRNLLMVIILLGTGMGVVDGIVVSVALPTITRFFGAGIAESQWVISAYLLTETSLLLVFGRLSERIGRGRLFLWGFAIFTGASLACGLAPSLPLLVLFRVIQATGGAMVYSISTAIVFAIFPKGEQGRAMGYVGATIAIAGIAAPVIGGFVTDVLGWEYIFLVNVPIGVVLLALALRYFHVPELPSPHAPMDWAGAGLMAVSISFFFLLLGSLTSVGSCPALSLLLGLGCIAGTTLFIFVEQRHHAPLLDLSVFRNEPFSRSCSCLILLYLAYFMMNLIGPFYLEGVLSLSPSQVGMVFLIGPIVMVIASPLAGWLFDRKPWPYFTALGLIISGISLFYLGFAAIFRVLPLIIAGFVPLAIGSALFQSPVNTEMMRALPPEQTGTASSVAAVLRNLGMTLGVSLASLLLALLLSIGGFEGPLTNAEPGLLSLVIAVIMGIAGSICCIGAIISVIGIRRERSM